MTHSIRRSRPKRAIRAVPVLSALTLAVASVTVAASSVLTEIPEASGTELISGVPVTAEAPLPVVIEGGYIISPDDDGNLRTTGDRRYTVEEIQQSPDFDRLKSTNGETMVLNPFTMVPTVLAGDSLTFIGGAWAMQGTGAVGTGGTYTEPPEGNWVPQSGYLVTTDGNIDVTSLIDYTDWPSSFVRTATIKCIRSFRGLFLLHFLRRAAYRFHANRP